VSSRGVEAPDSHPNESIQAILRLLVVADADRFRHAADGRLDTVLGHLHSISAHARGDALRGSVLTVLADAVAQFQPDHILIALRSPEHANWQERGLIEHVKERFGLPLTIFAIDPEGHVSTAPAAGSASSA